ncbi:hypothetical protein BOX15_Mlig019202g1 [Macrostomum lignano]|uniref:VASt domain-containing protein n=2 Tax=Macrostomum lignano TaxID=282301 RepID=A0A267EEP1_9PLAT|nr:hypothetical protein BOX15_Mlig019202g1 [Macrostomum lignano]
MSSSSSGSVKTDRPQQQQAGQSSLSASLNGYSSPNRAAHLPANTSSSTTTREWVETQDRQLVSNRGQQPLHRCRTDVGPMVNSGEESAAAASSASFDSATMASRRSDSNGLMSAEQAEPAAASASSGAGPDYDSSGDRSGGGRSEPSRSSQSRLRSRFNPLYKQRNALLHRLFNDLPAEERLVTDASCAWDRSGLLVQGRLYATASRLCFYSKIIGFETRFSIQLTSVIGISKERTARVIPNAISVQTGSDRYFFTSIGSRDRLHSMLDLLWQKAIRPEPLDPVLFWELVRENYGSQLGLDKEDADQGGAPSSGRRRSSVGAGSADSNGEDAAQATASDTGGDEASISGAAGGGGTDGNSSSPAAADALAAEFGLRNRRTGGRGADEDPESSEAGDHSADPCDRHEHFADEYLNVQLPANVDTVFQCLFAHKSAWFRQFARHRGMTDVCAEPWRPALPPAVDQAMTESAAVVDSAADVVEWRARRVTFTLPLNNAVGPRSAQQVEEQAYRLADCRPGRSYCVDVTVRSREVPYCDSFHTRARYCLRGHGPDSCRLRVTTDLRFTRSLFKIVRNLIDSSAKKGLAEHFSAMRACLISYLAARGAPGLPNSAGANPAAVEDADASAASLAAVGGVDALEADELVPDLQSAAPPLPADGASPVSSGAFFQRSTSVGSGRLVVGCLLALCCLLLICFCSLHARCNRLQVLLDQAALLPHQHQPASQSSTPAAEGGPQQPVDVEQLASAVEAALESLDGIRQSLIDLRQRLVDRRGQQIKV